MGKLLITPGPKFITLFHKTIKTMSDERKVKKKGMQKMKDTDK